MVPVLEVDPVRVREYGIEHLHAAHVERPVRSHVLVGEPLRKSIHGNRLAGLSVELRGLPDQVLDLVYPRIVGAVDVVGPVGDLERHEYRIEIDHLESPDLLIAGEYRQAVLPSDRIAEIGLREALVGYPRTSEVESAVVGIQRLDRRNDPSQVSFGGSAVEDRPE